LRVLFALLLAAPLAAAPIAAPELDHYAQSLRIVPAAGASAQDLSVTVAPLLNDAVWALTQRWDDNLVDSLRVRDLLKRRGMHGTFYLNASTAWYGNESRYPFEGDLAKDLAKALIKGGNSLGGHGLTHEYIPSRSRPEAFHELLGIRIEREVNSQSPINSFVFPFDYFRNSLEGDAMHADLARQLIQSGYLQAANQYFNLRLPGGTPLLDSWLLPCDGKPADEALKALLASERQREREPVLCVCMHAWPAQWGGSNLPALAAQLKKLSGRRHWWYPNANELSAYRWQALHGRLSAKAGPSALDLSLERFEPWDLGDEVPLTLVIHNAGKLTPTASLDGQPLPVSRGHEKGTWLLSVPQSPGHGLPQAYDWHRNPGNKAEGWDDKGKGVIEGLASRLWVEGAALHLRLRNSGAALDGLRIAWRLPQALGRLAPSYRDHLKSGETWALDLPLSLDPDPLQQQGRLYAAAQVDAQREGKRLRLYSDLRADAPARNASFPNGGFMVLGPLPKSRKDFDLERFAKGQFKREKLRPCEALFRDQQACWELPPAARAEPLHPELIPAGGLAAPRSFYTWDPSAYYSQGKGLHYLLAADIVSPREQWVKALYPRGAVKRIQVNGQRLNKGRSLKLREGRNRIVILYAAGTPDADGQGSFNILNYGPFFRLVGEDRQRLTDIRYEAPAELQPAPGAQP